MTSTLVDSMAVTAVSYSLSWVIYNSSPFRKVSTFRFKEGIYNIGRIWSTDTFSSLKHNQFWHTTKDDVWRVLVRVMEVEQLRCPASRLDSYVILIAFSSYRYFRSIFEISNVQEIQLHYQPSAAKKLGQVLIFMDQPAVPLIHTVAFSVPCILSIFGKVRTRVFCDVKGVEVALKSLPDWTCLEFVICICRDL